MADTQVIFYYTSRQLNVGHHVYHITVLINDYIFASPVKLDQTAW